MIDLLLPILCGAASAAIAVFWPGISILVRIFGGVTAVFGLAFPATVIVTNALAGCFPIWTGLTPAVAEYVDGMTLCPGQSVFVPLLVAPEEPAMIEQEERGRRI